MAPGRFRPERRCIPTAASDGDGLGRGFIRRDFVSALIDAWKNINIFIDINQLRLAKTGQVIDLSCAGA